jgi:hypothetical protein
LVLLCALLFFTFAWAERGLELQTSQCPILVRVVDAKHYTPAASNLYNLGPLAFTPGSSWFRLELTYNKTVAAHFKIVLARFKIVPAQFKIVLAQRLLQFVRAQSMARKS